jgi:putative endonuclease
VVVILIYKIFFIYLYCLCEHSEAIQVIIKLMEKIPCVYILANKRNGTTYVGVTSNLKRRIFEHKNNLVDGFTKRYNIYTLVYYEVGDSMEGAIEREKQIKGGSRDKKIKLIESINSGWRDLYNEL